MVAWTRGVNRPARTATVSRADTSKAAQARAGERVGRHDELLQQEEEEASAGGRRVDNAAAHDGGTSTDDVDQTAARERERKGCVD